MFKLPTLNAMSDLKPAPKFRLQTRVGILLDVLTGSLETGHKGQTIMQSGWANINMVCGGGNSFKSGITLHCIMTTLDRHPYAQAILYDTENTVTYARLRKYAQKFENLRDMTAEDWQRDCESENPRMRLTQSADGSGNKFFETIKDIAEQRRKLKAKGQGLLTSPVINYRGEQVKELWTMPVAIDSLSMFQQDSTQKIIEDNEMGDGAANTYFMKDGGAKTQMFMQLPDVTAGADMIVSMTAHVGNKIEISQYAPQEVGLTYARAGTKLKNVPEKVKSINNIMIEITRGSKCINQADKAPLYPFDEKDREAGNDLMLIYGTTIRNKHGQSGADLCWVASQEEGILPDMTDFHYIKAHAKRKKDTIGYGMEGSAQSYNMIFYPDVKLSRTTVRRKLREDHKLLRAVEIASEMRQMYRYWSIDDKYKFEPEDLYRIIKEKGYDWNVLLDTRSHHVYLEEEKVLNDLKPELCTWDILRMANDEYRPYWLKK